jgi:hypothetical protein
MALVFKTQSFHADPIAVQAGLISNCGEFAVIKSGVVNRLPNAQELDRVAVSEPISNKEVALLGFQHVGE